jgi:4'-phosphopantetheinyl transferase
MRLTAGVQIWPITLDAADEQVAWFEGLLASDEVERASRFRFERDRRSFVVCRAALRILLGRYLDKRAEDVRFFYGSKGKPRLAEETSLRFNVSHSGGVGLFAFAYDCEVGVDVETIRPMEDLASIAKQFFCAEERDELMSVPLEERARAFFLCWSRKEAFIKAIGEGLSVPLNNFRVTLKPSETAQLVSINYGLDHASQWSMQDVALGKAYAGAVAYRDRAKQLEQMEMMPASALIGREFL